MAEPEAGSGRAGDAAHPGSGEYGGGGVDMGAGGGYGGDDAAYRRQMESNGGGANVLSDSDDDLDEEALRIREGLADAP